MIAQIWRGRTRAEDRHDFTRALQETIQSELAISKACRGAYVLQREIEWGQTESLVLTLYDPGPLGGRARDESHDPTSRSGKAAHLLVSCEPIPVRYEVVVDPRRALLHARLRRGFPLRIAAPR